MLLLRSQLLALSELPCISSSFSLAVFKILSLYFNFAILIMCLGVGLFGFILIGTLCASWTCVMFFCDQVREVFCYYFFKHYFFYQCPSFLLLVSILYKYFVSCYPVAPLNCHHSFWVFFHLVLCLGFFFFYLVFQDTDLILCLILPAFNYFSFLFMYLSFQILYSSFPLCSYW